MVRSCITVCEFPPIFWESDRCCTGGGSGRGKVVFPDCIHIVAAEEFMAT
jgi:hypothetical protein